jgi:putative endonuclease
MSKTIGALGEDLAVRYLKKKFYRILERNYRSRFGEIDIIAQKKEFLVFIEVKTRNSFMIARPCESVGFSKQKKIILTAQSYIVQKGLCNRQPRFDVIEVVLSPDTDNSPPRQLELNHIVNSFQC